ncbi:Centromere protein J [Dictyocoela muelleri]|nr:Centromere protein J [Dictyocoela muelleri]
MQTQIKNKIKTIDALIKQMEHKKGSLIEILRNEIKNLRDLNNEYKKMLEDKKIIHEEKHKNKVRYHLNDGSTYVVSKKGYRYLYDSTTKVIIYEFSNGQIEKSYPMGIKEIRYPDGSICIKCGEKDYDFINKE